MVSINSDKLVHAMVDAVIICFEVKLEDMLMSTDLFFVSLVLCTMDKRKQIRHISLTYVLIESISFD